MHASAGIAKAMERFGEAENGEAEEGLARPAHPEGWAGGLSRQSREHRPPIFFLSENSLGIGG